MRWMHELSLSYSPFFKMWYVLFQAIETYANALVNTNGGILVFGIDGKGNSNS